MVCCVNIYYWVHIWWHLSVLRVDVIGEERVKGKKNKREEEKKDGEKQKWENSSSAANQEDKRVFHPQWYSSIQLFPQ